MYKFLKCVNFYIFNKYFRRIQKIKLNIKKTNNKIKL